MSDADVRADWQGIKVFTTEVFAQVGMPREDAETEADVLVWANLRGVDSHGVLRIPMYLDWVDAGNMNPTPNIRVLNETPATMTMDADFAFGPVVTVMAMNRAIEKAKEVGICWVIIKDTTHQGAMGYYTLMAARENMAGIASVCSPPNMAPAGAKAPGVHNSPISIAVPAERYEPLILDMATSVVAGGKIDLAIDKGEKIPFGWLIDEQGNPTTDPRQRGSLLPIAGPKGSGLAIMLECLSSLMVGNPKLSPVLLGGNENLRGIQNSFLAAIDIGAFTDVESYRRNVDETIDGIKSLPREEGTDEIFMPGEPEQRVYEERIVEGIPLPAGTMERLQEVSKRFGIPMFPTM